MKHPLAALAVALSVFGAAPAVAPVIDGSPVAATPAIAKPCGRGYKHASLSWGPQVPSARTVLQAQRRPPVPQVRLSLPQRAAAVVPFRFYPEMSNRRSAEPRTNSRRSGRERQSPAPADAAPRTEGGGPCESRRSRTPRRVGGT